MAIEPQEEGAGRKGSGPGLSALAFPMLGSVCCILVASLHAQAPDWWVERGLVVTNAPVATNDFAPANVGQLKYVASRAAEELEERLPGGAGSNIVAMIAAWTNSPATTNDFAALNVGQLKATAKAFYDRFATLGILTNGYPWTAGLSDGRPWTGGSNLNDFALANVGQIKRVFAFDLTLWNSDDDHLPDDWERGFFGATNLFEADSGDRDGDGLGNLEEYLGTTDPTDYYNGLAPSLFVVSGDNDIAFAQTFLPVPLVVGVSNALGALTNAPIAFDIADCDGLLSVTNDGTGLTNRLELRSDNSGQAAVWLRYGSEQCLSNVVRAVASSTGGVAEVRMPTYLYVDDSDADGISDWWEEAIIWTALYDGDPSNDNIDSLEDVLWSDDFDGDGASNGEEWQGGGDPTDPADAGSDVYYVDDGAAGPGTGTYADPYPTIQTAIDAAPAGYAQKRIIVLPGTYGGSGNTNLTFGSKSLVVRGMGGADQVIIDCGHSGRAFHFSGGVTNSAIQGVTIRGGVSAGEDGAAVLFEGSVAGFAFENCVFDRCDAGEGKGGAIALTGGSGVDLHVTRSLFVRNRAAQGAALYLAPHANLAVLIENCRIEENSSEGGIITLADSSPTATSIRIVNNTFINNATPAGTLVVGSGTAPEVANNIIAYNTAGIAEADGGGAGYKNNCVYNPVGTDYTGPGAPLAGNENILADPKIVSKEYTEAMLSPASPCIDAGDSISVESNTDYAGEPRIQIASVDIGAYEFVAGAPPPSGPTRIHVATDGNDSNDGGTWATAKLTLQAAINEITSHPDGIEIWIKAGTYAQKGIVISDGNIAIYGGFLGDELVLDDRRIDENPSIFDGQGSGVIFNVGVGAGANGPTIDGVEFRNAHKAVIVSGGSAVLKRCKVRECVDPSSAQDPRVDLFSIEVLNEGLDRWHASGLGSVAEIYDCDIADNDVGGIFVGAGCSAVVQDTRIAENRGVYGAGICAQGWDAYVRVDRCLIDSNEATFCGGGVFIEEGACYISNTRIVRNRVDRSVKLHFPELPNGNWGLGDLSLVVAAGGYCGGGVAFYGDSREQWDEVQPGYFVGSFRNVSCIRYCTIADNEADQGGGVFGDRIGDFPDLSGEPSIKISVADSILWGNESSDGVQVKAKDFAWMTSGCVQGGGGSTSSDPLMEQGTYRLTPGSGCIDAGSFIGYMYFALHPGDWPYDASNANRDMDGEERSGIPDIGADEFVDANANSIPDWWEAKYPGYTDDWDGLSALGEYHYDTDPTKRDTDGDRLPDGWEVAHGFDPKDADQNDNEIRDDQDDLDANGISNIKEWLNGNSLIGGGANHSVAADTSGQVWTWGADNNGQLGDGAVGGGNRVTPAEVESLGAVSVLSVAAGEYHSLALDAEGQVWAWGRNNNGCLGTGSSSPGNQPNPVQSGQSVNGFEGIIGLDAGQDFSLAVKSNGTVWAWGRGDNGRLGSGGTVQQLSPIQISSDQQGFEHLAAVSAGTAHGLALGVDGSVWAWGNNGSGRLGDGSTTSSRTKPVRVGNGLAGFSNLIAVKAGSEYSLALGEDGAVWAWGRDNNGQMGNGPANTNQLGPGRVGTAVAGFVGIVAISAGDEHALALKGDGTVWAWGRGDNGRLGSNSAATQLSPAQIDRARFDGQNVVVIHAASQHSLAITADGRVWAWGNNSNGKLGDGGTTDRWVPVSLAMPSIYTEVTITNAPVLPHGLRNIPYQCDLLTAGERGPVTWSVTAGALPDGLVLDPTSGRISGVPSAVTSGAVSFTIQATDGEGMDTQDFSMQIFEPPPAPTDLNARAVSGSRMILSWVDHASSEFEFVIERSRGDNAHFEVIRTLEGSDLTYFEDTEILDPEEVYYYRVYVRTPLGRSMYSPEASVFASEFLSLEDLALVWLDANAGVEADANNRVAAWLDQTTNGNDAGQADVNRQPIWQEHGHFENASVKFDGLDDLLEIPGVVGQMPRFSVTWYFKPSGTVNFNQRLGDQAGWSVFRFQTDVNGAAYVGTAEANRMAPGENPGQIPNGTIKADHWNLVTFVYSDGTGRFYKNGQLVAEKASMSDPAEWTGLFLGGPSATETIDGEISELIFCDWAMLPEDLDELQAYFAEKYHFDLDEDQDGLLDKWEREVFGNLDQSGSGDADSDQIPNRQDSNPTDPTAGALSITIEQPEDDGSLY